VTRRETMWAWGLGTAAVLVFLYLLRGMLLPFVAGLALAYFLDPVADALQRLGMKRTPAVVLIMAAVISCAVGLLVILVPLIQAQVMTLIDNGPDYAARVWESVKPVIAWLMSHLPPDQADALQNVLDGNNLNILSWAGTFLQKMLRRGAAVFTLLSVLIITPVVTFYMLRDWDRLIAKIDSWLPRGHAAAIRGIARDIDRILAGYLRGQSTLCLVLAFYYGIGLSFTGLDAGLVMGISTGLLSFIPYIGGIAGLIIGMALAIVQFSDWLSILTVLAVFLGGQFLEGYVLTPRLVGNKVGLHPVWVLFSLFAGASLIGLLGILIALPVAAVVGVLVRRGLRQYLGSSMFQDGAP